MAFISLKDFLSIWYLKLIGLIGPRSVSERVKAHCAVTIIAKNASFHKKFYSAKNTTTTLLGRYYLTERIYIITCFNPGPHINKHWS